MKQVEIKNDILLVEESLYAVSNGYIGIRATFEEGYPEAFETMPGTFLNGFYDTHQIKYSESAYGFPSVGETMLHVMRGDKISITIDHEVFSFDTGSITELKRTLDVDQGQSIRKVKWTSSKGHEFTLVFRRMTSFVQRELALITLEIYSESYEGEVIIDSSIDGRPIRIKQVDDPRVAAHHVTPLEIIEAEVAGSEMRLIGMTGANKEQVQLCCRHNHPMTYMKDDEVITGAADLWISPDQPIYFEKYMVYTDSLRHEDFQEHGRSLLEEEVKKGATLLFQEQAAYVQDFWKDAAVHIEGDDEANEAVKYSMYQLLAAAGVDGQSQIAAKGLTGAGYEGHYFWDTEIYALPMFTLTAPALARKLLRYRYSILPEARIRAKELGHQKGAKMPWRTITGRECSSYFPAGTAQYHINADVAYAYIQYYLYTRDDEMMASFGYEVLVETGRIWLEIGHYYQDEFRIDNVTGPDEYTAIVNNNYYTNAMAKYHMEWIVKLYEIFKEACDITEEERNAFERAASKMYLPFDSERGIHKQDDTFLAKKVWDFENTPKEKYPLLLHYHPLTIYRHQVLKQADTVLAHFLLDNASEEVIKASYDYYEQVTTHDSSLSPCVYGMMASRINNPKKAYDYLMKTLYLDAKNLHGNTKDGLHIANAGGTYMSMVYGFAGLRIKEDGIHLRPTKPKAWSHYTFTLAYQGARVQVKVDQRVTITTDKPISLTLDNVKHQIDKSLEVDYHGKH